MKNVLARITAGLLISVSVAACGQAPVLSAVSSANEHAPAIASAMFEQAVASPTVPGISVAIAGRDGIIWARGFGWADLENNVPMSTKTKMRIGSVAKPFTAAALMRLYDQGKVGLDADVRSYVPAWPEKHATITLRQLASHTSGIRHYEGDEFMSNQYYPTVTASLDIFHNN